MRVVVTDYIKRFKLQKEGQKDVALDPLLHETGKTFNNVLF